MTNYMSHRKIRVTMEANLPPCCNPRMTCEQRKIDLRCGARNGFAIFCNSDLIVSDLAVKAFAISGPI
jgi:hypothetical protein